MDTIDISKAGGYGQSGNIYESFYRLGDKGSLTPGLAQSVTVSADQKQYTFHLRDAKWSNGDSIVASDFVFSWRRSVTPSVRSPYAYLFAGIKNGAAIAAGKMKPDQLGITAPDQKTVVITLEKPIAYFKKLMAYPLFGPQNERLAKKYGNKFATQAKYTAYSGPFKLINWTGTENTWAFVKNPEYWDHKVVKLQRINYTVVADTTTGVDLYKTNKIDMTQLSVEQVPTYVKDQDFKIFAYSYVNYLAYNRENKDADKRKLLNNANARLAISAALDRSELAKKVVGDGTLIPTGFVATELANDPKTGVDFAKDQAVKDTMTYSTKLAKQYWAKAQSETGIKKISLTLLAGTDNGDAPATKNVVQYIKGQLEDILPGISIQIRAIPSKAAKNERDTGNFDIALSGWGADFNDPISFLELLTSDNGLNVGHYKSTTYDQLIAKAEGEDATKPEQRWQDLLTAAQLVNREQAVTPLYQSVYPDLMRHTIKGVIHNTAGTQWNYKYASIK